MAKVRKPPVKATAVKPAVTTVQASEVSRDAANRIVSIEIGGTRFGTPLSPADVTVKLVDTVSGEKSDATVTVAKNTLITARAEVPRGEGEASRWLVELEIKGKAVDTGDYRFKLDAVKPTVAKVRDIEVDYQLYNNPLEPTSHSLLVTPKDDEFSTDPTKMSVQILPPGATKITVEPALSPRKMLVTFSAPEGFAVSDLLVTSSDGGQASATANSKTAKQQASDKIKINRVDVLALQRRDGFGRIRISGEGFGQHDPPPYNGDLELLCDPEYRSYHVDERVDTHKKRTASDTSASTGKKADTRNMGDDATAPNLSAMCKNLDTKLNVPIKRGGTAGEPNATSGAQSLNSSKTTNDNSAELTEEQQNAKFSRIKEWRTEIEKLINVALVPRNPDFRIERTLIMYADNKVIDVYFEFSRWEGVSQPFRLDSVSVSAKREEPTSTEAAVNANAHHLTVADAPTKTNKVVTYLASHDIGPSRDTNLEYRYTVLDAKDASHLFGSGVGENFYVIQLSLLNKGDKKVIVPLASIQAEIEWVYYPGDEENSTYYDEGPATLSPMTLPGISSYFDLFQKTKGKRARLYNVLDGIVVLSASLVPVFGRNIERPNQILSGGFIPGLKKSFGDLSSQQLQNLTSLSWDSLEEIPAGGGKEKFVYIQRSGQSFSNDPKIMKEIKSIAGIEVSGFVVKQQARNSRATAVAR
ncbi:MAG: hypothetical protein ACR2H4_21160 [Pyrinomonadaceae bacterium]